MTIVAFDPQETLAHYDEYYRRQIGAGGAVYAGRAIMDMRGAGIGSFLGKMFKKAAPVLLNVAKSVGKSVGRQALNVAREALDGGDVSASAVRGLRAVGADALDDVYEAVGGDRATASSRQPTKRRRAGGDRVAGKRRRRQPTEAIPLDG
jgi:hypothetical protein